MLLRASGEATGHAFDLHAVTEGAAVARSGAAHEKTLLAFTEALVSDEREALVIAHTRVLEELGPEALEDAAGVASDFERMVRIADATGMPVDSLLDEMPVRIRAQSHLT